MKRSLLLLSFLLSAFPGISQCIGDGNEYYNFEARYLDCRFLIDTITDTNNVWQIGIPIKTAPFLSVYLPSPSHGIMTDTANSYPTNDTSSFIVTNLANGGVEIAHANWFEGYYAVNSDTIADHGTIEFSYDKGATWIDLLQDATGFADWVVEEKPVLSGNSKGWKRFYCILRYWHLPTTVHFGDTLMYRFSFVSDSVDTHKDGLAFDDLQFEDWTEGVENTTSGSRSVTIYPNPATDKLFLQSKKRLSARTIAITNSIGQLLATYSDPPNNEIDTHNLPPGMYLLHYTDAETNEVHKFSIQR